ncbi:MAG TPA: NAD-binding protein [Chitinophagaceae bacterium]|nr:NAD-binding protein [Chitinophagaceae bacterium]
MDNTAVIFGAGKTGRGFAAHLAVLGGYDIVLIDKNKKLVNDLASAGKYYIEVLGDAQKIETLKVSSAYHIDDSGWYDRLVTAPVAFTAVFGNNLGQLSRDLAPALKKRYLENPGAPLTIITCENLANAAHFFKGEVLKHMSSKEREWLSEGVGFSESIIFKTCLDAAPGQSPLTIRAQNFFELPCDGDAIKAPLHVFGLKPLSNFGNQLKRKIYTYNCINAVITYHGAQKGYEQLYDAGNDPEILRIAQKAAAETSGALIAEYHFDEKEQEDWVNAAFKKFSDRNIPDPIERNGADPARKLSRDDRLIGPALLALKHGIYPGGLLEGIVAAFHYLEKEKEVDGTIEAEGIDVLLQKVCGLSEEEELFTLIKEKYTSGA